MGFIILGPSEGLVLVGPSEGLVILGPFERLDLLVLWMDWTCWSFAETGSVRPLEGPAPFCHSAVLVFHHVLFDEFLFVFGPAAISRYFWSFVFFYEIGHIYCCVACEVKDC